MRTTFIAIVFLILSNIAFSQSTGAGTMSLAVIMPKQSEVLDDQQLSRLQGKIVDMVAANGFSSNSYSNRFVIYPKFYVSDNQVVEGGLQNIQVTTIQFSLVIKQVDNGIIYSSISKTLKGSGNNKYNAINSALNKINTDDESYQKFIAEGKAKIISYYQKNGDAILAKAAGMQKMGDYAGAINLLMTVPVEVPDVYAKAQAKAIIVYKTYQSTHCEQMIKEAMAKQAAGDIVGSLNVLMVVDPESKCNAESKKLIQNAQAKMDATQKKEWQYLFNEQKNDAELSKYRTNAMAEIAKSYYSSNSTIIDYTVIAY